MNDVTRVMDIHDHAARKAHRASKHDDKVVLQMWQYVQHLAAEHIALEAKVELLRRWYRPKRNARFDSTLQQSFKWLEEVYAMTKECDPYEQSE